MRMIFGKHTSTAADISTVVAGGTFNYSITLVRNPVESNEAATKQYVDTVVQNLSTSIITTGVVPVSTLPAIGGDFYSMAGTKDVFAAITGVTPGWKAAVVIDSKGRVQSGGPLVEEDYPNIDYSLISSGHPTTLAGYGITDALTASGGTLTDNVRAVGDPVLDNHPTTKRYAEDIALSGGSNGLAVGDIVGIFNPFLSDETGFLRCNGAQVDIATYPGLYSKIGSSPDMTSFHGHGRPWEQQKGINSTQESDISGWVNSVPIPLNLLSPVVFATKSRVYHCCGWRVGTMSLAVQTAIINPDGTLGTWSSAGNLPFGSNPGIAAAVVIKDKVFIFGGTSSSGKYTFASIDNTGLIGTWEPEQTLPFVSTNLIFAIGNKLYAIKPEGVYQSEIDNDGMLSEWRFYDHNPPQFVGDGALLITRNNVYIVGYRSQSDYSIGDILVASYDQAGNLGTFEATWHNLPYIGQNPGVCVTDKVAYITGSDTSLTKVWKVNILSDGKLGSGVWCPNLPGAKSSAGIIATSNRLYLLGGSTGSSVDDTVFSAAITGGTNDFSSFYKPSVDVNDPTHYGESGYAKLSPGNGRPWQLQYEFNTLQPAVFGSVMEFDTAPNTLTNSQVVVTKNSVFFIGGNIDDVLSNGVKRAVINPDGTIGITWGISTSLPVVLTRHRVIVVANTLYVIGGYTDTGYSSQVYKTTIGPDGNLGSWSAAVPLPIPVADAAVVLVGDRICVYGGTTVGNVRTANTYHATLTETGTYSSWVSDVPLTAATANMCVAVTRNKVYLIGGEITSGYTSTMYEADIDVSGRAGSIYGSDKTAPVAAKYDQCVVTRNHIYLMQPYNGTTSYLGHVFGASIDETATIESWSSYFTRSQISKIGSVVFTTRTKLYIVGGTDPVGLIPSARFYHTSFDGGLSDYSIYYSKPVTNTSLPTKFFLPFIDKPALPGVTYYVKY